MDQKKIPEVVKLLQEIETYKKTHKIEFYQPYDFQRKFHFATASGDFVPVESDRNKLHLAILRALQCGNQTGKSTCGGMETAYHLTGLYSKDWQGHYFPHPVEWLCSSTTNETTKDRCQTELMGDPADDSAYGTGAIPKYCLGQPTRKPGVPNACESIMVKHFTEGVFDGWSKCYFKSYDQGAKKFMGYRLHGFWDDEEPPREILSQQLRSCIATDGIGYLTYTPEEGMTEVVHEVMHDPKPGWALLTATWDDAPHLTPDKRNQKLMQYPVHEREMREKGIPMVGTGLVWPVSEDQISIAPFDIPYHWARICGFDIGYDHPAAIAWLAVDRDKDAIYLYDAFKQSRTLMPVLSSTMKARGDWIPVMWPHDGMKNDPKSGKPFADWYRNDGVNMHRDCFSNPASPGQKEGQGGNGVEVGLIEILTMMETGRFKVFNHLKEWFDEWRMYHRKDGQVVKIMDDLMSATRYAVMMRRFATTKPVRQKPKLSVVGMSNW